MVTAKQRFQELKKLLRRSGKDNQFFMHHIFFPDGMFEKTAEMITMFFEFVQLFAYLSGRFSQCLGSLV